MQCTSENVTHIGAQKSLSGSVYIDSSMQILLHSGPNEMLKTGFYISNNLSTNKS